LNRPPSRANPGKSKASSNVVPLFKKKVEKTSKIAKPRENIKLVRTQSKRLLEHERKAKSVVTKLRPNKQFGRKVSLAVFGAVFGLAVLVVVAVFSPLLAVREIEIVGTSRVSEAAILKDLSTLKGKPLPQISSEELAQKLSKFQLIDSVSAVALPPSTLRVVVVERSAVAVVNINGISYLYDAAGVQLGRASSSDHLPVVENAGNPSSSTTFSQAIKVILSLPISLLPKVSQISAVSKDNVVLHLNSFSQKILWGDDSEPALKGKVLAALMKHYAGQYGCTFDVSAPGQPSVY
jgi:cell division protein FtsQ